MIRGERIHGPRSTIAEISGNPNHHSGPALKGCKGCDRTRLQKWKPHRNLQRPPDCSPSRPLHHTYSPPSLPFAAYLSFTLLFFTLLFFVAYYLLHRWRDKIRTSTPLHVINLSELAAVVSLIASFIYLLGFFGIDFVQSFISRASHYDDAWDHVHDDDVICRRARPGFAPGPQKVWAGPVTILRKKIDFSN